MAQKIRPFIWLVKDADKAAKFYTSVFRKSEIVDRNPMSSTVRLEGLELILFSGGPQFKPTPAISLFVTCKTQKEVDYYWDRLGKGGKPVQCGWLTDRYGVSWQVVPEVLQELLFDDDEAKAHRTMQAMLKMKKLDIAKLKRAHAGR
jgi:two-component system sensor histidine kinase QseC